MGLPTALLLAKSGFIVNGYDIDLEKIDLLKHNKLPFEEPGLKELLLEAVPNFRASNRLLPADAFIITVPTPLTKEKTCDLSFVLTATESIKNVLRNENLVILESTVPPGTTIEKIKPILYGAVNKYYLSYVSEKAIPGNTIFEMQHNHRIIGGIDYESSIKTKKIYQKFVKSQIHLTDATTAETVKLLENTYRDVNIALSNEIAQRLSSIGVNVFEAIRLANFHPRVQLHKPGPGVGGHCIAIDPWFLASSETELIKKAREINENIPKLVSSKVEQILNEKTSGTVVLLGAAYKGNVDDDRESPAYSIKYNLETKGINVRLYDPLIKNNPNISNDLESVTKDADCLVLVTDHSIFKNIDPMQIINMNSKTLIDTRDILDHEYWKKSGFNVQTLGR